MNAMLTLILSLVPGFAVAACPSAPDHSAELAELFDAARAAPNEAAARPHSTRMWELWTDAPDEPALELLMRGIASIRVGNYVGALEALDRLVDYCPDYAEGWNQRAFARYLTGNHESALGDLERTIEINPEHVGALAGLGLTLIALGREEEAQEWLQAALALNPWLNERHLLDEAPGTDL